MTRNVLLISDHGDPLAELGGEQAGGQNNYVYHLSLALEKLGYTVDVVTHWNNPALPHRESFSDNCQVIRISAGRRTYLSKNDLYHVLPAFYAEMTSELSMGSYELVHTHYWLSGLLGVWLQRDYGVPFVHTSHSLAKAKHYGTGMLDTRRFAAERHIIRSAQAVIATTPYEQDLISSFEPNSAAITVVPCGVSEIFAPAPNPQHPPQHPTYVYAGRLVEEKGIFTLLSAFRDFTQRHNGRSNAQLLIAGGESSSIDPVRHLPRDRPLKNSVQGLEHAVKFLGPQTPKALARLFNQATATIVPSHYESFGMVAAESLACGTPVIASRTGGLQHVVEHGKTGLLFEPRSSRQLASMMGLIAGGRRFAPVLGENGYRAAARFRWDVIAQAIHKVYREVSQVAANPSVFY